MLILTKLGSASTYVESNFLIALYDKILPIIGCISFSLRSISSEVEYWPDLVFLGFLLSDIFSNNNSPICFGDDILKFSPAISCIVDVISSKSSVSLIL